MKKQGEFLHNMDLNLDRRKFTVWQKFMHYYEKNKKLRLAFGTGLGVVMGINLLILLPGKRIMSQSWLKEVSGKTFLQAYYFKAVFLEGEADWRSLLDCVGYYSEKFVKDVRLT